MVSTDIENLRKRALLAAAGQGGTFVGEEEQECLAIVMLLKYLAIEIKTGLKMSRISALSVAKKKYGLKGNKRNVFLQVNKLATARYSIDLSQFLKEKDGKEKKPARRNPA